MNIYIRKDGNQLGPLDASEAHQMLLDGRLAPNDLACREGDSNWSSLVSVLGTNPGQINVLDREFELYDSYSNQMSSLLDQMAEADGRELKELSRQLDQKLQIAQRHVDSVRSQFPDAFEVKSMDADILFMMARQKISQHGFLRSSTEAMVQRGVRKRSLTSLAVGAGARMVANSQDRNRALEAVALFDKSIATFDTAGARFAKALTLKMIGQNAPALQELNYIVANFQSDDTYMQARQLKDEIENPPKKGMCFVATATFGDYNSPEVIFLSQFRDNILARSQGGRSFINFYYKVGPYLARPVEKSATIQIAMRRMVLTPTIWLLKSCIYQGDKN